MINDIRRFIKTHYDFIPEFFLPQTPINHYCFNLCQECILIISKLARRKIATNLIIWNIHIDIESHLDAMSIADKSLSEESKNYIILTLELFEKVAAANDEYEIAANMLKLRESMILAKNKNLKSK